MKMGKILRNISIFSFWLAGMALVAHLVIPHDHHISDTFSDQNNNCPAERPVTEHHNGFPIHCHAFNDLAAEKVVKFNSGVNSQYFFTDFICESDLHLSKVSVGTKIFWSYTEPVPSYILTDFFRLRAPPELA
jgi:hypothetical protein